MKLEKKIYASFHEVFVPVNESDRKRTWFNARNKHFPLSGEIDCGRFQRVISLFCYPSVFFCPAIPPVSGSRNLQLRFRSRYGRRVLVAPRRIPNQRDSIRRVSRRHVRTRAYVLRDPPVSLFLFTVRLFFRSTSPRLFFALVVETAHWSSSFFLILDLFCVLLSPSRLFLLLGCRLSYFRALFLPFGSFSYDFSLLITSCTD